MARADIIISTNLSNDNGFGKMPLGIVSVIAGALPFVANGFNFRFISCVACAPQSSPNGSESTTCVVYDSVSCF